MPGHRLVGRFLLPTAIVAVLSTAAAKSQAVDDPGWKLPPGFTIELVAGPPLVQHPTMGGFDDQGRLYICDGPGENMPAKDLLAKLPNYIRRLEDTDGDGKFDKSVMYADKMTFPMGALWHDGYVYTASPPNIWRLRDADGDGIAEERKVLVSEFGFTGNAADIHGCFLGPDGRIYWCDGRHGHNFTDEHGNPISKGLAARLFSCKPDGSDVEAFAGGGMDNPVEVCFTEEGEPLGTVAIFDNKPDRVDAIIHWVYGGAYPYYPKVMDEFKKTGDLLPAVSRFGRVAPSGIMRYRHPHFGDEYQNNLFHAQFNTHRVVRTILEREGASFKSTDEDFLVSENQDVHLTDVIEDADGSLLVVDTGGWFRIGCPTSQIAKPEILGGIYRIRRTDGKRLDDSRGLKLAWNMMTIDELTDLLDDERPAVRDRAISDLARRISADEEAAIAVFDVFSQQSNSLLRRRNAIWALARGEQVPITEAAARHAKDPSLQQSGLVALGKRQPSPLELSYFRDFLSHSSPAVRREVATAFGRWKATLTVPMLLSALETSAGDRFLEHAIIYALIQIKTTEPIAAGLYSGHPNVRRGALIALDQNNDPTLTKDVVAKLLDTTDAELQRTVLGVMQKHPDWGDEIVGWLKKRLTAGAQSPEEAKLLSTTLLAYKADPKIQELLAAALADSKATVETRKLLLEVIERSELTGKQLPPVWSGQIARHLTDADDGLTRQAIQTALMVGAEPFDGTLIALARDAKRPEALRIAALKAVGPRVGELDAVTFTLLYERLRAADSLDRLAAADVLGIVALTPPQRAAIVEAIASAGPLELPALLTAFEKDSLPAEGKRLIEALGRSPGLENVTSAKLEKIVAAYPDEIRKAAEPLFKRINADIDTQRARLKELAAHLEGGDKIRGKNIFTLKKTSCIACHKVGNDGAQIGPDLTKVGQIRSQADLLESVIFPSASFVRGYESVAVTTSAGLEVSGILSRETPEAVYLKTAQKEEVRIARSDIEEIAPSKVSIMPQGLDKTMALDEIRDLIAYLQTLK